MVKLWIVQGVAATTLTVLVAGCCTTEKVLKNYESHLTTGAYSELSGKVGELAAKGDDTRLLWHLLAGSGYYLQDDKAQARGHFDRAEEEFLRNDRMSVFAQGGEGALAMMTNDRAFSYDGGGIDRVFTCLYKAIDFLSEGKPDDARVELNRCTEYQTNWLHDRRRDIEAAAQRLERDANAYEKKKGTQPQVNRAEQTSAILANPGFMAQIKANCQFDPATSGNLDTLSAADYMNAYALHVTGVFRWLRGDGDLNHLRDAAAFAATNPTVSRDYAEFSQNVRPKNQVWIWIEDGLCPSREEWRVDLPLVLLPFVRHYLPYVGMALPVLRERTWGASSWAVQCSGGERVALVDLANVDKLVKTEYDVYMRGAITREITRTIVKAGVQVALGVTSENVSDRNTQLALKLSQIGAAAWAASSTAADLRSWTTLPKTVKCIRVDRPADGKIDIWADGQQILLNMAEGNSFVFVRKPGPQAMPVVKQVTFK